jgi:hypothetical protein
MKEQASPFVTRETHDLEIYGDDKAAITEHIRKELISSGLKEGKDFSAKDGKINFTIDGKEDIGIEVFTHGTSEKAIETYKREAATESESPTPSSLTEKHELAFGYESRPGVRIGNKKDGFIETQDLAEQAVRKIAGSTMYRENILQPQHGNRFKDITDTVTVATAFAVKGKVPIEKDVVTFVNKSYEKFAANEGIAVKNPSTGEIKTYKEVFAEKVSSDPVVDFIYRNQRLPTITEAARLDPKLMAKISSDRQVLFDNSTKELKTGNRAIDEVVNGEKTRLARTKELKISRDEVKLSPRPRNGSLRPTRSADSIKPTIGG